jgi:hypothetical protein
MQCIRPLQTRFPKHHQQRQFPLVQRASWHTRIDFEVDADRSILERLMQKLRMALGKSMPFTFTLRITGPGNISRKSKQNVDNFTSGGRYNSTANLRSVHRKLVCSKDASLPKALRSTTDVYGFSIDRMRVDRDPDEPVPNPDPRRSV